MTAIERCPHCFAAMAGMTNGFGGVYLQCMDCGYYEAVRQIPSPYPDRVERQATGKFKGHLRRRHARVPGAMVGTQGRRKAS